jgi:hypothetical protein
MRITFTVDLHVTKANEYPSNDEIIELINTLGWRRLELHGNANNRQGDTQNGDIEVNEAVESESPKSTKPKEGYSLYKISNEWKERIDVLINQMKEVIISRGSIIVIYYGYIQEQQTEFIITRQVDSQITFRFLNENMSNLQRAAERVLRQLKNVKNGGVQLSRAKSEVTSVYLYEKNENHIIIQGRVIKNHLLETIRRNQVITIIGGGCALFGIAILAVQQIYVFNIVDHSNTTQQFNSILGQLDRVSSGLIVAALTSYLQLIGLWWDLKRSRVVVWDFSANS